MINTKTANKAEINKQITFGINLFTKQSAEELKEAESFSKLLENRFDEQLEFIKEMIKQEDQPAKTNTGLKIDSRNVLITKEKQENNV
jgi:hypothetical protein